MPTASRTGFRVIQGEDKAMRAIETRDSVSSRFSRRVPTEDDLCVQREPANCGWSAYSGASWLDHDEDLATPLIADLAPAAALADAYKRGRRV